MKKNIKTIILLLILAAIFLFSISQISLFLIDSNSNKKLNDKLIKEVVKIETVTIDDVEVEKITIDFDSLLNTNKRLVIHAKLKRN